MEEGGSTREISQERSQAILVSLERGRNIKIQRGLRGEVLWAGSDALTALEGSGSGAARGAHFSRKRTNPSAFAQVDGEKPCCWRSEPAFLQQPCGAHIADQLTCFFGRDSRLPPISVLLTPAASMKNERRPVRPYRAGSAVAVHVFPPSAR